LKELADQLVICQSCNLFGNALIASDYQTLAAQIIQQASLSLTFIAGLF
jgi:hypothetical protein